MWTQHNPSVPIGVIVLISKGCFWQISNVIIKFVFTAFLYLNPSTLHIILNWYWHTLIKVIERENEIDAWRRSCLWPFVWHRQTVSYKPRTWALSIYVYTSVKNDFQNSLRQTSKFTWNEVDNWCNFAVPSISE